MQTSPAYNYTALPTEEHNGQYENNKFSSENNKFSTENNKFSTENIIYTTITETVNNISCNKNYTDTNEVGKHLLEDNESQQNDNKDPVETYRDCFYNIISKCICINFFN